MEEKKAAISRLLIAEEEKVDLDLVPNPVRFKIVSVAVKIEEKTAGGIILSGGTKEDKEAAGFICKVVKVGSGAFKDAEGNYTWNEEDRFKPGDYIMLPRYSGSSSKVKVDGVTFIIHNDEAVLAKVPNPEAIDLSY